ncbi:MAG: Gfo/Idh/MocA family oxidoreductase [Methylotenera sp.]|nr:Gfo/Idh/MocA family oxidoreductase [Oligoflexia bacterium]
MTITPLILGSGSSGQAISTSFATLKLKFPDLKLALPVQLMRGSSLVEERRKYEHPVLCIANPHGLHAQAILDAEKAGYEAILCEKPACVNSREVDDLRAVKVPTAVLHGYRQTWGVQTLKQMIEDRKLGEVISIEGRYWQASTAERALIRNRTGEAASSWKNDTALSGDFDVFLDIATHWMDAASFLHGSVPREIHGWRSYINAETAHRDSHVQLMANFSGGGRAFGSISKTVHGSTHHFELNVIGSLRSATWKFLEPDQLIIGEGRDLSVFTRKDSNFGSRQSPFHAQGWLEGYIEIAHQLVAEVFHGRTTSYPRLSENLDLLEALFKTRWNRTA